MVTDPDGRDEVGQERRRGERYVVSLHVDYDDADDLVNDYTENISSGGICISSDRVLERGAEVRLALSFPGLVQPIAVRGIVRWTKPEGSLAGIEFVDVAENVQLAALVARVRDRDPALVKQTVRVLVVEDNRHIAELLQAGLGVKSGLDASVAAACFVARDGREALTLLRTHQRFDAMIVDVYLPVVDGPTLIRTVRTEFRDRRLPIIAMSCGGDDARSLAMTAGADTFLEKPMRLRSVVDKIRELVQL
jgi:uncharacterized protein (TIGR02266 family)